MDDTMLQELDEALQTIESEGSNGCAEDTALQTFEADDFLDDVEFGEFEGDLLEIELMNEAELPPDDGLEAELELAAGDNEGDLLAAMAEFELADLEDEPDTANLDDLVQLAHQYPGLKITVSF